MNPNPAGTPGAAVASASTKREESSQKQNAKRKKSVFRKSDVSAAPLGEGNAAFISRAFY